MCLKCTWWSSWSYNDSGSGLAFSGDAVIGCTVHDVMIFIGLFRIFASVSIIVSKFSQEPFYFLKTTIGTENLESF